MTRELHLPCGENGPLVLRGSEDVGVFLIGDEPLLMHEVRQEVVITNSGQREQKSEQRSREGVRCPELFQRPPELRAEADGWWVGETSCHFDIEAYHETEWLDCSCEIRIHPGELRGELRRREVKDIST